jgi:hypothetical protein
LVAAGNTPNDIQEALQELLSDKLSVGGIAERGNREKAITILMKMWVRPPADVQPLRDDGLDLLPELSIPQRLAVHWGLSMAVYPFWGAVAETTGRLLRLQGTAAAAQVQRRVREQLGQRETVARAARRVLRSFYDWGVLEEGASKGVYVGKAPIHIAEMRLIGWLMESYLLARKEGRASPKAIADSPAFFPFLLDQGARGGVCTRKRLELTRHGLDDEILTLNRGGGPGLSESHRIRTALSEPAARRNARSASPAGAPQAVSGLIEKMFLGDARALDAVSLAEP